MYKYVGIYILYSMYKFCAFITRVRLQCKTSQNYRLFVYYIYIYRERERERNSYINKVLIFIKDKSVYLLSYRKNISNKSYFPFVKLNK